jgi:ATP-dependent DNA helicase RecG
MIEDIYTEFKQLWRDEFIRYISAFCNTKGGVLYIGINDKGEIIGVDNAIFLLENLPNIINSKTGIMPMVELLEDDGKEYISIFVQSSVVPISYNGHYYTRSGSVTSELHGSHLNSFLLQKMGFSWESMIEDKFTIDDIDINAVAKFKSLAVERIPLINTENDTLKLIDRLQLITDNKFKKAAVLLFAKDTQRFYLQARIRIVVCKEDGATKNR